MWLARVTLMLLIAMAPVVVSAQIDLTGSWKVSVYAPVVKEIVQSGTTLTIGEYSGTIDPVTGSFALESPPAPGGIMVSPIGAIPYGPSPPGRLEGDVAADGNSFSATQTVWGIRGGTVLVYPWTPIVFAVAGVRRDLTSCGDARISGDELCDAGAANGAQCCSSTCTPVDSDEDGTCDAEDDCPTMYNYGRCAVPLTLRAARADAKGRFRARGTLAGDVGNLSEGALRIGDSSLPFFFRDCRGNAPRFTRYRCHTGAVRAYLSRRTSGDDWRFAFMVDGLGLESPFAGPLGLEVIDRANSRKADGEADSCVVTDTYVSCTP